MANALDLDAAARAARKADAEGMYMRGGAAGMATAGGAAVAAHLALQRWLRPPAYLSLNWRLKLFLVCAATTAGFAIGAEQGWLKQRSLVLAADAATEDAAAAARWARARGGGGGGGSGGGAATIVR